VKLRIVNDRAVEIRLCPCSHRGRQKDDQRSDREDRSDVMVQSR
jgi:hypothetical protein